MHGHSRGGRRSKGERRLLSTRLPIPVYEAIHQLADTDATSASEYVARVLAAHVGRPDLVAPQDQPEGLPLAM